MLPLIYQGYMMKLFQILQHGWFIFRQGESCRAVHSSQVFAEREAVQELQCYGKVSSTSGTVSVHVLAMFRSSRSTSQGRRRRSPPSGSPCCLRCIASSRLRNEFGNQMLASSLENPNDLLVFTCGSHTLQCLSDIQIYQYVCTTPHTWRRQTISPWQGRGGRNIRPQAGNNYRVWVDDAPK